MNLIIYTPEMPYRDYEFRDLVAHSGADRNVATNWVQKSAIAPRIGDTSGTGVRRQFDFFNLFEGSVAHKLSLLPGGIPTRDLALALDAIRIHVPGRSEKGRSTRVRDQLARLPKPEEAEATLLGFALSVGPGGVQSFADFLDPETRDPSAQFWLVWSPRLRFGELVDSKPLLDALLADIDIVVVVKLNTLLFELEQKTGEHWTRPVATVPASPPPTLDRARTRKRL